MWTDSGIQTYAGDQQMRVPPFRISKFHILFSWATYHNNLTELSWKEFRILGILLFYKTAP